MSVPLSNIATIERVLQTIVRMHDQPRETILKACTTITRDPTAANSIMNNFDRVVRDPKALENIPFGAIRTTYRRAIQRLEQTKRPAKPVAIPQPPKSHTKTPRMSLAQIAQGKKTRRPSTDGPKATPFARTNREAATRAAQKAVQRREAVRSEPVMSNTEFLIRRTERAIWADTQARKRRKLKAHHLPHTH